MEKVKEEYQFLNQCQNDTKAITLIALVITILFSYDYGRKCRNSNKFLFYKLLRIN